METLPSSSVQKTRRRKRPVFVDEPIQWHLRHTKHDRCPWCGLNELDRRGANRRICKNPVCEETFAIRGSAEAWFETKLSSGIVEHLIEMPPSQAVSPGKEVYTLEEAQIRSETGRGFVHVVRQVTFRNRIFWHREGHLPERYDANSACAPGSGLWYLLSSLRDKEVWTPDEPMCEMEVLARAYGTDEPMFAIMEE